LAAELASATSGLTGADIAYLCQRAAMFCVKDAVGAGEANEGIAITRHHFDTALGLLTVGIADRARVFIRVSIVPSSLPTKPRFPIPYASPSLGAIHNGLSRLLARQFQSLLQHRIAVRD
jgi:hypothetical protein